MQHAARHAQIVIGATTTLHAAAAHHAAAAARSSAALARSTRLPAVLGTATCSVRARQRVRACLVAGMLLDNAVLYPDSWFEGNEPPHTCVCYSRARGPGGGWIMTAHALWHIIALVSTVVTTAGTEYVLVNSHALQ